MKIHRNFDTKDSASLQDLYEAISLIKTREEAMQFFEDLCTPTELEAMADRFSVVSLVKAGISYRKIHAETKVSVTTIGRVARALMMGEGGYHIIYNRLLKQKSKIKK